LKVTGPKRADFRVSTTWKKHGNLEKPWKTALFGPKSWKTVFWPSFNDKTWKKTGKLPFWTKIG